MAANISQITNSPLQLTDKVIEFGPLKALESSGTVSNIRYPKELAAPNSNKGKNNKNHWVTFTIQDIKPASSIGPAIQQQQTNIKTNELTGLQQGAVVAIATAAGAVQGASTGAALAGALTSNIKAQVGAGAAFGIAEGLTVGAATNYVINTLTKGIAVSPQLTNTLQTISLYMPDNLVANYNASYEEMSLTQDLGPTITTLRAITSAVGKGGGSDIGTNPSTIQAVVGAMQIAGVEIPGVEAGALGTLLQRAEGYALNPQIQMVYRGSPLREFTLSFKLTPRSKDEADQINDIIDKFKFYASPSLGQISGSVTEATTNSMFLIPPSVFNVQFFVNGAESTVLPKYGECVLISVEANYAPNGFAAFVDGSMVQTELTLSFKELNILTRNNFNDGQNSRR
jgi:hypothetical protein